MSMFFIFHVKNSTELMYFSDFYTEVCVQLKKKKKKKTCPPLA